jgi:hypothetical protein
MRYFPYVDTAIHNPTDAQIDGMVVRCNVAAVGEFWRIVRRLRHRSRDIEHRLG